MEELKTCPFCGHAAGIFRRIDIMQELAVNTDPLEVKTASEYSYYIVTCANSECRVAPEVSNKELETSVKRWNERVEE
jgi:hypothetical protein